MWPQYWQVSSVVLKALGTAAIESNKDSSRMVCVCVFLLAKTPPPVYFSRPLYPPTHPHILMPSHPHTLTPMKGRMVDFQFKGLQIVKLRINCLFLDQVRHAVCHPLASHLHSILPPHLTSSLPHSSLPHSLASSQTRLVSPNPTEQNYHIFYQLMAGLTSEEKGAQLQPGCLVVCCDTLV